MQDLARVHGAKGKKCIVPEKVYLHLKASLRKSTRKQQGGGVKEGKGGVTNSRNLSN